MEGAWFEDLFQGNGAAPQPWHDVLLLESDLGAASTAQCWDRDQYQQKHSGFTALW